MYAPPFDAPSFDFPRADAMLAPAAASLDAFGNTFAPAGDLFANAAGDLFANTFPQQAAPEPPKPRTKTAALLVQVEGHEERLQILEQARKDQIEKMKVKDTETVTHRKQTAFHHSALEQIVTRMRMLETQVAGLQPWAPDNGRNSETDSASVEGVEGDEDAEADEDQINVATVEAAMKDNSFLVRP